MSDLAERLAAPRSPTATTSSASSAPAAWPRSTSRATSGTTARSRSRCCAPSSPPSSAPSGFSARSRPPPTCSIRTSSRCFDSGEVNGTAYYVMPFVDGESLRDRLAAREAAPGRRRGAHRDRGRRARSTTPTATASSIATSSRRTSCCTTAGRSSPTSGLRSPRARPAAHRMTETGMSLGTPHVHESRAGDGRARDHRAHRRLRPRVRDLRDAGRRAAVHRADGAGDRREGDDRGAAASPRNGARSRSHVEAAVLHALEKLPADRFATAASSRRRWSRVQRRRPRGPRRSARAGSGSADSDGSLRQSSVPSPSASAWSPARLAWPPSRPAFPPVVLRYAMTLPDSLALVDHNGVSMAYAPDGSVFAFTSRLGLMLRAADRLDAAPVPGARDVRSTPSFPPTAGGSGTWMAPGS